MPNHTDIENALQVWRGLVKERVGGFDAAIDAILHNAETILNKQGPGGVRGIVLYGPPGCGKSHLASALAAAVTPPDLSSTCIDLTAAVAGASEALSEVRDSLAVATRQAREACAPTTLILVVLEKAEVLIAANEDDTARSQLDPRMVIIELIVSELRRWRDESLPAMLLMPWGSPTAVPSELCRSGAFEGRILLPTPLNREQRRAALAACAHSLPLGEAREAILDYVAHATPGFLPCDLDALCRGAALAAVRRSVASGACMETVSKVCITQQDFGRARQLIDPTPMRGAAAAARPRARVEVEDDHGGLSTVIGQPAAVEALQSFVVTPFRHLVEEKSTNLFEAPIGVLITGAPGTGKTYLATQMASELGAHTFAAAPADLLASRVGDAEKRVTALFDAARRCAPSVIILEDVDAIAPAGEFGHDDDTPDTETCAPYVLRSEIDTLRLRRTAHAKLCSGGHRFALASEAAVIIIATARDPSLVAGWLLVKHRLSQTVTLKPELSVGEVGDLLRRLLSRCGQCLSENVIGEVSCALCAASKARPASIVALCRTAAAQAVRRAVNNGKQPCMDGDDLHAALATI